MSSPQQILSGLGGATNVAELEACITRLRVEVKDPSAVSEEVLKEAGAFGVVQVDNTVQVVVGPVAEELAEQLNQIR